MHPADQPICVACGTQYDEPRESCALCCDERQFVPPSGQQWTSLERLRGSGYAPRVEQEGPRVTGIGSTPSFAIGQRALLVHTGRGNVLWDCVAYLDDELVEQVDDHGGITAMAVSHPHYYTTMHEWAHIFDVPLYLHESDREWITRTDDHVELWSGPTHSLSDELTLINLGVHFAGGSVLHWADGAGTLFSGDIVQVLPDHNWVGFMYSYPMFIPERASTVRKAVEMLEPFDFDAVYGAWWHAVVREDGKDVVRRSAKRYLDHVGEP